jgi:hypothetical protein
MKWTLLTWYGRIQLEWETHPNWTMDRYGDRLWIFSLRVSYGLMSICCIETLILFRFIVSNVTANDSVRIVKTYYTYSTLIVNGNQVVCLDSMGPVLIRFFSRSVYLLKLCLCGSQLWWTPCSHPSFPLMRLFLNPL